MYHHGGRIDRNTTLRQVHLSGRHQSRQRRSSGKADMWILLIITVLLVGAMIMLTLKLLDQSEEHVKSVKQTKFRYVDSNEWKPSVTDGERQIEEDLKTSPDRTEARYQELELTKRGFENIGKMRNLQHLQLNGCNVKSSWFKYLEPLPLESLDLTAVELDNKAMKRIAKISTLRNLNFESSAFTDDLLKELQPLSELRNLSLKQTQVTDEGLKYLTAFPKLHTLVLGFTKVTDKGCETLAQLSDLKSLNIEGVFLKAPGLKKLKGLDQLKSLAAKRAEFGDAEIEAVCEYPNLTFLTVSRNPFTEKAMSKLARMKTLRSLYMDDCPNITPAAVDRLRKALPDCNIVNRKKERD